MKRMRKMENNDTNNSVLSGASGAPGIVMGNANIYKRRRPSVSQSLIDDEQVQAQLNEFEQARDKAEQELNKILKHQQDQDAADLVRTQIEMLKDPELNQQIKHQIKSQNQPADAAVELVFETYLSILKRNQAQNRSVDITDIRDRLIQILHDDDGDTITEGAILVARELSPREVVECAEKNVQGIIMDFGGTHSHAAIIARSMGLPTILGTERGTSEIADNDQLILDGKLGQVIINPDEETRQQYQDLMEEQNEVLREAESVCRQPNETKDGAAFSLRANIEFIEELLAVKKYCAEGIGLLRTESFYLRKQHFGDASDQEEFYKSILEKTVPHPVTIRLFDAGGDKLLKRDDKESNPFLGWRGIRMLLDQKELLKRQLKAICKTATVYHSRVEVLIPMVSAPDQIRQVRTLLQKVQEELQADGFDTDKNLKIGIMVEVPNVALQAELFAEEADFLSIGTNDLTQYVLAVDRGNERIANLYDQRHPMIWALIKNVADAACQKEIPLSVCGELASDPVAACCLRGLGITELSMNPTAIPAVKKALREHTLTEMEKLADQVAQCQTIEEVDSLFTNWI